MELMRDTLSLATCSPAFEERNNLNMTMQQANTLDRRGEEARILLPLQTRIKSQTRLKSRPWPDPTGSAFEHAKSKRTLSLWYLCNATCPIRFEV
ncbi:expressed unknown protein [Ectocarpus siliculosus]|uniref:Uncharacterized protein n=1 Tax=Ectocarpus siliculosus TaxID=2880 RepID=D8LDJ0_ECTSI|nr:expressed unknown protein [Ectocarpus siliculosus]|eukprot:CBN74058.1 expressed unknown protein [Ectocarpus siliculosus]